MIYHAGKCSNPMTLTRNDVQILGYEEPALEGESIMFTCTSGKILNGPNSSMCMGNGEWKLDPRDVNCTHVKLQPTNPVICGHPQYVLQIGDSITTMTYKEFRNSNFNSSLICCSGIVVIEANTMTCLEEETNTTQLKCESKCQLVSCIISRVVLVTLPI